MQENIRNVDQETETLGKSQEAKERQINRYRQNLSILRKCERQQFA